MMGVQLASGLLFKGWYELALGLVTGKFLPG